MFAIPRRYNHFVFAGIQAGLTGLIAAGIASLPLVTMGQFLVHWLVSWVISWLTMLPVVVLAAPLIRSVSFYVTSGEKPKYQIAAAQGMSAVGQ
jgi:hypothetical protein